MNSKDFHDRLETRCLAIESICIEDDAVTIAGEVVLVGLNYSEPAYTNIFCNKAQLIDLMLEEASEVSRKILTEISNSEEDTKGIIQIDLGGFNNKKSWRPELEIKLIPIESKDYGFACYDLKVFIQKFPK